MKRFVSVTSEPQFLVKKPAVNHVLSRVESDSRNYTSNVIERNLDIHIPEEAYYEIHDLARFTQITPKTAPISYAHGFLLYQIVSDYASSHFKDERIVLLETGSARGFSAVCMALALEHADTNGLVISVDILPHNSPILWNSKGDDDGPRTRSDILRQWRHVVDRYCLFLHGPSELVLNQIGVDRFDIVYFDSRHKRSTLCEEYEAVKCKLTEGTLLVFDDYDESQFPEVVAFVNDLVARERYSLIRYKTGEARELALLTRV